MWWSKSGEQTIFQEGYEYNRRVVKEMEKEIKTLKWEVKRELETVRGQQALVSDTSEDWESEKEGDKERSLTPLRREVEPDS